MEWVSGLMFFLGVGMAGVGLERWLLYRRRLREHEVYKAQWAIAAAKTLEAERASLQATAAKLEAACLAVPTEAQMAYLILSRAKLPAVIGEN